VSTDARNQANRAYAEHSTGPRTEAGKAISSLNALMHRLTARTVLLPGEDPAVHQALTFGMFRDLDPINTRETPRPRNLIDLTRRLDRLPVLEGTTPQPELASILRSTSSRTRWHIEKTFSGLAKAVIEDHEDGQC
jgi:hypothetical protein